MLPVIVLVATWLTSCQMKRLIYAILQVDPVEMLLSVQKMIEVAAGGRFISRLHFFAGFGKDHDGSGRLINDPEQSFMSLGGGIGSESHPRKAEEVHIAGKGPAPVHFIFPYPI